MPGATNIDLTAFVPRLALEMHAEGPGARHRRVPGSMVFVDISGFTAMSERLARFGKVGAEEVTDVLDFAFTRLLAVAYENDGSLLKFGGDALLLFFAGEHDASRACHAAHGMREKLRELGGLDSSAGKVRLRMSVGVHTGEFDFFLVGGSHRDLIVAGPAASATVVMEGTADAGEIVVSAATRDALPEVVTGQAKGEGFLLRRAPSPSRIPRSSWGVKGTADATDLLPRAVRHHLHEGASESEHRSAVIAFVHFDGVDDFLGDHGPEATRDTLDALVRIVQTAADEHDVSFLASDIDVDGGKFILGAGVPAFHADDDERILRTLRAIVDAKPPLPLKLGANRGPLFAGAVGPPYRMTYTVMGDTVNLAARVMARADHGQVLATPVVLERCRADFEHTAIEPFHAKGKAEPVRAFAIGNLSGRRAEAPAHGGQLPLVGRDDELALLMASWASASTGSGRVVELLGPAGIGKSRLVAEFRSLAEPRYHLLAECDQYESSTPYYAFRSLLRHLLGVSADDDPTEQARRARERVISCGRDLEAWLPLIALAADIDVPSTREVDELDPKFRAIRLRETIAELFVRMLSSPTMIRIEDAHWMDEASRALLTHLIDDAVARSPWLVVISTRERGPGGEAAAVLDLQPLGPEAALSLAHRAAAMGLISLAQVDQIIERAGGHPLFLQELLHHAASGGALPDSIESLVGARIDQLPPRERMLLRHAALLGQRFDLGLLRSITGEAVEPATLVRLTEFVRHVDGEDYEFEHALFRDTAYEALTYRRRRELHDLAGRVIETRYLGRTEEAAELLALHYYRAGRHDRAWRFNRVAADRARARFANDTAARFYAWAIESGRKAPDVDLLQIGELYRSLGDLLEVLGSYDEADRAYGAARKIGPPERVPDLLFRQGIVRERTSRFSGAVRWYRRALEAIAALEDGSDDLHELALTIRLREAEARMRQGRANDALDIGRKVLEELREDEPPTVLARAHFLLGWALRGNSAAHLHRQLALGYYIELDDLAGQGIVWMQAGNDAYDEGRWEDALDHWQKAGELKARLGDAVQHAIGVNNAGEILSDRGQLEDAVRSFTEARRVWQAAGFRIGLGVAEHNLGRAQARSGADEAEFALDSARTIFTGLGSADYIHETNARIAELHLFRGDHDAARSRAKAVLANTDLRPGTELLATRVLGGTQIATGDARGAQVALLDVTSRHAPEEARFEHACAELALAAALTELGDHEDAAVVHARARVTLDALGVVTPEAELLAGPNVLTRR